MLSPICVMKVVELLCIVALNLGWPWKPAAVICSLESVLGWPSKDAAVKAEALWDESGVF